MDEPIQGIPLHVDLDTICSIEYLRFSCGISQCYAIINVSTHPSLSLCQSHLDLTYTALLRSGWIA